MRWLEHLGLAALFDNAPLIHHHHLIGNCLDGRNIMRDEHIGQPEFRLQTQQQLQNAFLHNLVESGCHLVTDNEIGICRQRAGDADTLFLATRQFSGKTLQKVGIQLDHFQQFDHPIGVRLAAHAKIEFQRPANDIAHRLTRVHRCIGHLIDHLDTAFLFLAPVGQPFRQCFTVKNNRSSRLRQQAGNHPCGR